MIDSDLIEALYRLYEGSFENDSNRIISTTSSSSKGRNLCIRMGME